jgi:hypothetical protein
MLSQFAKWVQCKRKTGIQRMNRRKRNLLVERMETRHLMAVLLFDNFDPLNPANFSDISGGRTFGASNPGNFHDGNTLYFDGNSTRSAMTTPLSVGDATLEFRLRLGDVGGPPFENIDFGEEVLIEGTIDGGTNWILINEFSHVDTTFILRDTWALASFPVPTSLQSPQTQFRWRQKSHSSSCCDHWGIDEVKLEGSGFILTLIDVNPNPRNTSVDVIDATFKEPIQASSFTMDDVRLTRDGIDIPLSSPAAIQFVAGNDFQIIGLAGFTGLAGNYELVVDGQILTSDGTAKDVRTSTSWIVDLEVPVVKNIVDVTPDPRTGTGKSVASIDIVFSEPIDLSTFDFNDLTLTRDNGVDLIDSSVTISQISNTNYRVNNLGPLTDFGGRYAFEVDGDFADLSGNLGGNVVKDYWLSNDPPVLHFSGTRIFPEDFRAIGLTGEAIVTDLDSPDMRRGTLTVSIIQGGRPGDQLGIFHRPNAITRIGIRGNQILHQGLLIGTFAGGDGLNPLVVTLTARATPAAVQALVRNLNYQFVGDVPVQQTRRIQTVLTDGEGGTSRPALKTIILTPVNDDPILTLNNSNLDYTRDAAGIVMAPAATVTDVDNANFYNGTLVVQITSGRDSSEQFGLSGDFSMAGSEVLYQGNLIGLVNSSGMGGRSLILRFNEFATESVIQSLVRSITFRTIASTSASARNVAFTLRDGKGGVSVTENLTINFV